MVLLYEVMKISALCISRCAMVHLLKFFILRNVVESTKEYVKHKYKLFSQ